MSTISKTGLKNSVTNIATYGGGAGKLEGTVMGNLIDSCHNTRPVIDVNTNALATATLTAGDSGNIYLLNFDGGTAHTLPAAEAGLYFDFHVGTTITGSGAFSVVAASSADTLEGVCYTSNSGSAGISLAMSCSVPDVADYQFVADEDAKGRFIGSHISYRAVSDSKWQVTGHVFTTGSGATPFA